MVINISGDWMKSLKGGDSNCDDHYMLINYTVVLLGNILCSNNLN